MKLTWPRSHSLVILLLIYSAIKKVRMLLHEAPLGTFVHGVSFSWCGTVATPGACSLSTAAVNICIRPYSAGLSFIVQAFTFHIAIMEHVLHHMDVWTSTFLFWVLPRIEGKVCVLVEAEGHVMTTAVISCCTSFSISTCHVGSHK